MTLVEVPDGLLADLVRQYDGPVDLVVEDALRAVRGMGNIDEMAYYDRIEHDRVCPYCGDDVAESVDPDEHYTQCDATPVFTHHRSHPISEEVRDSD